MEVFKYSIVTLNELLAKKYHKNPFLVMDFSGDMSITMETLPAPGDRSTLMTGYWEGSHYTHNTVTKMLDRMFAENITTSPTDFGIVLSKNNIIEHFQQLRQKHANSHIQMIFSKYIK